MVEDSDCNGGGGGGGKAVDDDDVGSFGVGWGC